MTQYSSKWKPAKAEKKAAAAQVALHPGEEIWFLGQCNNMRPLLAEIAVTPLRVLGLQDREIKFECRHDDISNFAVDAAKGTVGVTRRGGEAFVFKMVPKEDLEAIALALERGRETQAPEELLGTAAAHEAETAAASDRAALARASEWPGTNVKGKLARKASEAILRQCQGAERPWLILTSSGGAGTLVAFDDRLLIIKTGALTSFMAGSLGGERSATFHFTDVTGIEYNSGFVNGVLEVLTPSYNGTANRDFWQGVGKPRNADSNDPWTLSNCLPLSKMEYRDSLTDINELKARISTAKSSGRQPMTAAPSVPEGLPAQLAKLGELRDTGVLSEDEFAAAKARVLGGS